MAHENNNDFYKLNFSQREGKVPLPEPMRLEYIPLRFRQLAWKVIDEEIRDSADSFYDKSDSYSSFLSNQNIGSIVYSYKFDVLGQLHDEIEWCGPIESASFFKKLISGENYYQLLTLIEFVLRHERCSENLRKSLVDAFEKTPVAYFVDDKDGLPTIMPRVSREAGEATRQAIETLRKNSMEGAATHLRQAAKRINDARHINDPQFADSVRESISAVESVARRIAPNENTLGDALKSLEKKGLLKNNQLKKGFELIYAYTNSEEGVRHSLVFKDSADVGLDEAMFMFGACASFAAYLTNKHQQMETEWDSV